MDGAEEQEEHTINIQNCYNRGKITGRRILDSPHTGGICGCVMRGEKVIINNCYNVGNIEGSGVVNDCFGVGGILGAVGNWGMQAYATIANSYNIGNISSNLTVQSYIGKILGLDLGNGRKDFSNLYYLNTSTGGANIHGGVAQTEGELKDINRILGENFMKDTNNINNGYPVLKWEVQ